MRRRRPSRVELVDRKHRLEGEINVLRGELRRLLKRGHDTAAVEHRLARAQQQHYRTRLEIDRTAPDTAVDQTPTREIPQD